MPSITKDEVFHPPYQAFSTLHGSSEDVGGDLESRNEVGSNGAVANAPAKLKVGVVDPENSEKTDNQPVIQRSNIICMVLPALRPIAKPVENERACRYKDGEQQCGESIWICGAVESEYEGFSLNEGFSIVDIDACASRRLFLSISHSPFCMTGAADWPRHEGGSWPC